MTNNSSIKNNYILSDNWNELCKNPWKVFPNYNPILDNQLQSLSAITSEHSSTLFLLEQEQKNLQRYKNKLNKDAPLKLTGSNQYHIIYSFFLATLGLLGIFFLFILLPMENKKVLMPITCFTLLPSIFLINYFLARKEQRKINLKNFNEKNAAIQSKTQDLNSIALSYRAEVNSILKPNEYINIREHLNVYYHTNIKELNDSIQNILEEVYPNRKNIKITGDIAQDSQSHFSTSHIDKISIYLNEIIKEKTISILGNKLLEFSNSSEVYTSQKSTILPKRLQAKSKEILDEEAEWERF